MRIINKTLLFILVVFSPMVLATNTPSFVQGKDYQVVTPSASVAIPSAYNQPSSKVQVLEFFSYGCPACDRFEPYLEKWLQTKPVDVAFDRIPVIFENGWDVYAKAYYITKSLGLDAKLNPIIFNAIHKQNLNLSSQIAMRQFLAKQGVKADEFDSAYDYSTLITLQLNQSNTMMQAYQVMEVPTVIIAGKYKVSAGMVNGDYHRMLQILNYLIQKSSKT